MTTQRPFSALWLCLVVAASSASRGASAPDRVAPDPGERQLPDKMHSAMSDLPTITVGQADAEILGKDNRALQAAVDYIANLGGGVVNVGPGEYAMRDSLHLRSHVTVRGTPGKTILRKADGAASALAMDGDYGEEQVTLKDPSGFEVGHGITVWDAQSGGFHTTVARITGRRGNTFSISRPLNADCMMSNKAMAATVFPVVSGCDVGGVRLEGITMRRAAPLVFLPLALLSAAVSAQVTVTDPWVRATIAAQSATGAFMQLTSPADSRLVEVRSSVAKIVEIHEMAMEGNIMRMRQVPGLELPAGRMVELKPGGYHVMMMGLKNGIKSGDKVPLTLVFEDKNKQRATVEVTAIARPLAPATNKKLGTLASRGEVPDKAEGNESEGCAR